MSKSEQIVRWLSSLPRDVEASVGHSGGRDMSVNIVTEGFKESHQICVENASVCDPVIVVSQYALEHATVGVNTLMFCDSKGNSYKISFNVVKKSVFHVPKFS